MEPFFISAGLVALAEIGDKTQLLSLVLAARFRRPWPIVCGIFISTLVNHGLAGALGHWITQWLQPQTLRWILGGSFMLMAAWLLVPDKLEEDDGEAPSRSRSGVFMTTVVAFFLAEMGDKTQIATVMLAARFQEWIPVVLGTTVGMMVANVPVVWFGDRITRAVPLWAVRTVSAVIFVAMGVFAMLPRVY